MRVHIFGTVVTAAVSCLAFDVLADDIRRDAGGVTLRPVDPDDLTLQPILLRNGEFDYGHVSGEFLLWDQEITFYRASDIPNAPDRFRWSEVNGPIASARWELCQRKLRIGGKGQAVCAKVAEGVISKPPQKEMHGAHDLDFDLKDHIPEYNELSGNVFYEIRVFSTQAGATGERMTNSVAMTHLPKSNPPPEPPPLDIPIGPYDCDPLPSMARDLSISVPSMKVHATTGNSGDGDRDEAFFLYQRLGPGSYSSGRIRLPHWPPNDDGYYEAHDGRYIAEHEVPFHQKSWTDPDEQPVAYPHFGTIRLLHDEAVRIDVVVQEQDNKDLKALRDFTIGVHAIISAVAHAVGDFWGHLVGATADAIIIGNKTFVEPINADDLVGFFQVSAINKCGYLLIAYTTPMSSSAPSIGETIDQQFVGGAVKSDPSMNGNLSVKSAVMKAIQSNFYSWTPVDFTAGAFADPDNPPAIIEPGKTFEVQLDAHGTKQAHYTIRIRTRFALP